MDNIHKNLEDALIKPLETALSSINNLQKDLKRIDVMYSNSENYSNEKCEGSLSLKLKLQLAYLEGWKNCIEYLKENNKPYEK